MYNEQDESISRDFFVRCKRLFRKKNGFNDESGEREKRVELYSERLAEYEKEEKELFED